MECGNNCIVINGLHGISMVEVKLIRVCCRYEFVAKEGNWGDLV